MGSRAHVPGHICCCPFERLNYALLDHWHQIMVFDTLYLMVPLFKGHLSLTWHSLITEGVDSGGTQAQTNTSLSIRCPTSRSAGAVLRGWGGGPRGTHPSGCTGAGVGDSCLKGTHLPSWEGGLLVILIKITALRVYPGSWLRIAGGTSSSWSAISW